MKCVCGGGEGGEDHRSSRYTNLHSLEIFFKSSVNRMWRSLNLIEGDNWRGGAGNYAWRLLA